jgi:hypothetical protein
VLRAGELDQREYLMKTLQADYRGSLPACGGVLDQ